MAKKEQKLTKQMIENINSYSDEIITLEDFVEEVRENIGMYIGDKGNTGFINIIREILQNSIDEMLKASSPCQMVILSYDENTRTVIVQDDGRGIPFTDLVRIYTSQHTGSNYNKKKGEYSSGKHGVGAKVTNALAEEMIVKSHILGEGRKIRFCNGHVSKEGIEVIKNPEIYQGTIVEFRPWKGLGETTITAEDVLELVQLLLPLTNIGNTIIFNAVKRNGTTIQETLVNQDGIITDLIRKTTSPLIAPIMMHKDNGTMKADIALTFDSNDFKMEEVTTYGNFCPTTDGTHLKGFLDGLTKFFCQYMNKIYLGNQSNKKNKLVIVNNDIKTGLKAIVSVAHLKPLFGGQAKETFRNEDMYPFVKDLTYKSLEEWSKQAPSDLQRLCKYFKDVAEIRCKEDKEKVKISNSYKSNFLGLPKKYDKPLGDKDLELWIFEGDSAGGQGKSAKDKRTQGVMPIRGKLPNAFTTERSKFLANEEVSAILYILLNQEYKKGIDITNNPWKKVVFGTDADPDGAHIRVLLLRMFLLYLPQFIEDGRVYAAIPPLYGIPKPGGKKGEMEYFTDRYDYITYLKELFVKQFKVQDSKGRLIDNKHMLDILYRNVDYVYDLNKVANTLALDGNLLEMILSLSKSPFDTIKTNIEKNFRFMKVYKNNNTTILEGLVNQKYQTAIMNEQFMHDLNTLQKYITKNDELNFNINGQYNSLYDMMKLFESIAPKDITRYKGLGEMNQSQLGYSTMHPDGNRTLIQYTTESAKKDAEKMRYYNDNIKELINVENQVITRFDIMG